MINCLLTKIGPFNNKKKVMNLNKLKILFSISCILLIPRLFIAQLLQT